MCLKISPPRFLHSIEFNRFLSVSLFLLLIFKSYSTTCLSSLNLILTTKNLPFLVSFFQFSFTFFSCIFPIHHIFIFTYFLLLFIRCSKCALHILHYFFDIISVTFSIKKCCFFGFSSIKSLKSNFILCVYVIFFFFF